MNNKKIYLQIYFFYVIIYYINKKGRKNMNQILSSGNGNRSRRPHRTGSDILDMKKIIIIFSIIILVFAMIIIIAKIFGMAKERNQKKNINIANLNRPNISVEEKDNKAIINISYDDGLNKVAYWWNEETVNEINMNGSTKVTKTLDIPSGDYNVLHLKATALDNSYNELEQEFKVGDYDPDKPTIDIFEIQQEGEIIVDPNNPEEESVRNENVKLKIIARSNKGMKNIIYHWEKENGEITEEIVTEPDTENQKELITITQAERGKNRLFITATDLEGGVRTKEKVFKGISKPTFEYVVYQTESGNILNIKVKHDSGFKKVIIKINGQEFVYDENNPEYKLSTTNLEMNINIEQGEYSVEVSAYTQEMPSKEFKDDPKYVKI